MFNKFRTIIIVAIVANLISFSQLSNAKSQDEIALTVSELNWVTLGKGPTQKAILWGDPKKGDTGMYIKMPPGKKGIPHKHNVDYHGLVVQGTWIKTFGENDIRKLPVGSYVLQPGEEWHSDGCEGPEECIIFVHSSETRNVTRKPLDK